MVTRDSDRRQLTPLFDIRRTKGETARRGRTTPHLRSRQTAADHANDRARDSRAAAIAALDEAQRRADAARYQEVTCRSALNPVKGMPFNWTLNPYRGCTHACHYCFARRYQTQFELGPGDHFSSRHLRQDQPGRRPAARARQAVVDARAGGRRHRHRSVPADRRTLQADPRLARRAAGRPHAGRPRHEGADGRARRRSARGDRTPPGARST